MSDKKILDSWRKNAAPWTKAVRENEIESRNKVTNQAIVSTLLSFSPDRVLDIGCGEGWLARALSSNGISVTGIDAVDELIEAAKTKGGGDFQVCEYERLSKNSFESVFDIAVCNFSLLGKESVERVFEVAPSLLNKNGLLIVQTLFPSAKDPDYINAWHNGSWDGFNSNFVDPAPWYFRTMESWTNLFDKNGFDLIETKTPRYEETNYITSIIMVGRTREPMINYEHI